MTDNHRLLADVLHQQQEILALIEELRRDVDALRQRDRGTGSDGLLHLLAVTFGRTAFSTADVLRSNDAALTAGLKQRGLCTACAVGRRLGALARAGAGIERVGRERGGNLFVIRNLCADDGPSSAPSAHRPSTSSRAGRKLAA